MQILKKWWFWIIVFVILVVFFFPKNAGYSPGSSFSGKPPQIGEVWSTKDCSCLGFKLKSSFINEGPKIDVCFGIPFSCKCLENKVTEERTEEKEIACK